MCQVWRVVLPTVDTAECTLINIYTWQSRSLLMWLQGSNESTHCEWQAQAWPWYEIQGCSLRQWGMSDAQVGLILTGSHLVMYLCERVFMCAAGQRIICCHMNHAVTQEVGLCHDSSSICFAAWAAGWWQGLMELVKFWVYQGLECFLHFSPESDTNV